MIVLRRGCLEPDLSPNPNGNQPECLVGWEELTGIRITAELNQWVTKIKSFKITWSVSRELPKWLHARAEEHTVYLIFSCINVSTDRCNETNKQKVHWRLTNSFYCCHPCVCSPQYYKGEEVWAGSSCLGMHFDVKSWESNKSDTWQMGVFHNDSSGLPYGHMQAGAANSEVNHASFFWQLFHITADWGDFPGMLSIHVVY